MKLFPGGVKSRNQAIINIGPDAQDKKMFIFQNCVNLAK